VSGAQDDGEAPGWLTDPEGVQHSRRPANEPGSSKYRINIQISLTSSGLFARRKARCSARFARRVHEPYLFQVGGPNGIRT
jgi:hypothetical protein